MTDYLERKMNFPNELSPALQIGLSISLDHPELARRMGQALRLVEAGNVCRSGQNAYTVYGLTYAAEHRVIDGRTYVLFIEGADVVAGPHGYYCGCDDYTNGIVGWALPYPPRVELVPGYRGPCCCHVLAVHVARLVEVAV